MSSGYQARPKIHVIRVVFQDQALYARTSFRGAKTCKIGEKRVCFSSYRQIKKNACKNAYLGFFFIPEKYVIRVLFESPWTSLIPLLPFEWPPPPGQNLMRNYTLFTSYLSMARHIASPKISSKQ